MLFDSTILIDFLNGAGPAATAIRSSEERSVSIITWIEVLAGARTPAAEEAAHDLLSIFDVLQLTREVAAAAVVIRRERRLKLPDAVILATATWHGLPLVTRNTKDFPADDASVHVPYRL